MAIKLLKNKLSINQIIEEKKENIIIEGVEIVPDIKPDILSVVECNGNYIINKKEIRDLNVKIEGFYNMYITYIANDQLGSLRSLNANIFFSKTFQLNKLKSYMDLNCKIDLIDIECIVLNERKINIKINTEFKLSVFDSKNIEYIDSVDDENNFELLRNDKAINSLVGKGKTKSFAKDTIMIDNIDNLVDILKCEVQLSNSDTKISYNKVLTKSDINLKIIYLTDDQRVNSVKASIPLMGFIDIDNLKDTDKCETMYEFKNLIVKPNNISEHSIHIEIESDIYCYVYRLYNISIVEDLYSKNKLIKFEKEKFNIINNLENINSIYNFKKEITFDNIKFGKIFDCEAKIKLLNEYIENDNIIYKAEALISIIYKDENSKRTNIRNIIEDFDFKISSDKIRNNMNYNTKIDVVKNNFIVIDDNKVNLNLDIRFNIDIMIQDEINLIDKIEEEKDNKCYYSFCIYYAKKKDSLWDIAKKFRSTVNEIIKMNNLNEEEEIIEGQQLFIPR